MDNVPAGFTAGPAYIAGVSAANNAGGEAAAKLLGEALGGYGEVALIGHDAALFVTRQRRDGVVGALSRDFPGIKVVEERAVAGPDFAAAAQAATTEVLTTHPRLGAIWAVWDVPAQGVIAALHMAGRDGIKIVTHDLGSKVAANMMGDGPVFGIVAQRCFDQGIAEATLAGYALLNKPAPAWLCCMDHEAGALRLRSVALTRSGHSLGVQVRACGSAHPRRWPLRWRGAGPCVSAPHPRSPA